MSASSKLIEYVFPHHMPNIISSGELSSGGGSATRVAATFGWRMSSHAFSLLRFAGRIAGMYPDNDPVVAMKIDEVVGHIDDLELKLDPSFREKNPEKRRALRQEITATILPAYLGQLNSRLAHWKQNLQTPRSSLALGGEKMTIADLLIHNLMVHLVSGYMSDVPKDIANTYEHLVASYNAVKTHPRVRNWNEHHQ